MIRPPMFSKSVRVWYHECFHEVRPRYREIRVGPVFPAGPPATCRLTAGGAVAAVLLTVGMLGLAAVLGIVAGLAPAVTAHGTAPSGPERTAAILR